MFEKFKNLFKKKNKINPQILVGQNLDDAHIGLLSGANSQNVDNVEIESNENVEINPSSLVGKSLEAENDELSKLNSDNVVDGVKYVITGKVSPPIDPDLWKLRQEEPKYDFSNFDNDDLDNLDETVTYEEKGKNR